MNLLQKAVSLLGLDGLWGDASRQDGNNFRTNMVTLAEYQDGGSVGSAGVLALSAAWACVNLLAGTIASLPLMVYRTDRNGQRTLANDHPLYRVLHDSPNADQTAVDFWEFVCACLEMHGNAYCEVERGSDGRVIALSPPIVPEIVNVKRSPNGDLQYEWTDSGRVRKEAQASILHIRGFGGSPLGGLSTLSFGRQAFALARSVNLAAHATFRNGVRSTGAFISDKPLTPEQQTIAVQKIESAYTGAQNAGRPMLLNNGMSFQSLSINPEDAQMLESRGFSVEEICRFFGVPPHMVGHTDNSTSWGTGLEQQTLGFQKFTLRRRLKRIEQALEKQLLTARDRVDGITIEFNLEGLLRADSKSRADFYNAGLQNGWFTINEVRALENMPPVEGGEVPRMQMQNVPITEAGAQPPVPPPADDSAVKAILALEAKFDAQAQRPASPPPVINVRMPELKLSSSPVTVTAEIKGGQVVKTVKRDDRGLIESWTEEQA